MAPRDAPAVRLEAALELWEDGVEILRENLRRRYPTASATEIERKVSAWLADRPLDAEGVLRPRPRRDRPASRRR